MKESDLAQNLPEHSPLLDDFFVIDLFQVGRKSLDPSVLETLGAAKPRVRIHLKELANKVFSFRRHYIPFRTVKENAAVSCIDGGLFNVGILKKWRNSYNLLDFKKHQTSKPTCK